MTFKENILDKLPRRIDGDGNRWFAEEDIDQAIDQARAEERREILEKIESLKLEQPTENDDSIYPIIVEHRNKTVEIIKDYLTKK